MLSQLCAINNAVPCRNSTPSPHHSSRNTSRCLALKTACGSSIDLQREVSITTFHTLYHYGIQSKNLAQLFLSFLLATFALLASCKKSPEEIAELLSDSEAAELVETSMSGKTAGLTMPVVDATRIIEGYLNNCNVPGRHDPFQKQVCRNKFLQLYCD